MGKDVQESERENEDDGEFGAGVHLHFPDEEDGQDSERPICYGGHGAMGISNGRKCGAVQAASLSVFVVFRPQVVDRTALEH